MFTSVKKHYRFCAAGLVCLLGLWAFFAIAKKQYASADFGSSFAAKANVAQQQLATLKEAFAMCGSLCGKSPAFLQALVFPEAMRYHWLKDGIEAESLRTLYVELGQDYADFSIGLFQMKPSFALQVEQKTRQLLPDSLRQELLLDYEASDETAIRLQRVNRLQNPEWQMVYLTAFVAICDRLYSGHSFANEMEKLQWYATVYNAGFDKTAAYLEKKLEAANYYLRQDMPEKKFNYAAIAGWYFKNVKLSNSE
jgi:hypothetical protein